MIYLTSIVSRYVLVGITIVVTVTSEEEDIISRLEVGVDILNVSGQVWPQQFLKIRETNESVSIIATCGEDDASILRTIEAGANAITFTPPSTAQIFFYFN